MILPTKHLMMHRTLLAVGGEILTIVREPKTMSRVWGEFSGTRDRDAGRAPVSYDWFVLALDFLFIIGAVTFRAGRIERTQA